jgi:hypothetical protein
MQTKPAEQSLRRLAAAIVDQADNLASVAHNIASSTESEPAIVAEQASKLLGAFATFIELRGQARKFATFDGVKEGAASERAEAAARGVIRALNKCRDEKADAFAWRCLLATTELLASGDVVAEQEGRTA